MAYLYLNENTHIIQYIISYTAITRLGP